ncbi:MAG: hypothetical protein LBR29_03005, partial [Methylobacteriaceae bacterium]|nr:hypothetical protein [Methylobacteriaceae bacterium]
MESPAFLCAARQVNGLPGKGADISRSCAQMLQFLFGFNGRMTRSKFILAYFGVPILLFALAFLVTAILIPFRITSMTAPAMRQDMECMALLPLCANMGRAQERNENRPYAPAPLPDTGYQRVPA